MSADEKSILTRLTQNLRDILHSLPTRTPVRLDPSWIHRDRPGSNSLRKAGELGVELARRAAGSASDVQAMGTSHSLKGKVKHDGLTIEARRAYFAAQPSGAKGK